MNSAGEGANLASEPLKMENKPKDRDACLRELGYAWVYMHYLRPGWLEPYNGNNSTEKQKKRVETLMMEIAVEWRRENSDPWWQSFYDRIIDEIENMRNEGNMMKKKVSSKKAHQIAIKILLKAERERRRRTS